MLMNQLSMESEIEKPIIQELLGEIIDLKQALVKLQAQNAQLQLQNCSVVSLQAQIEDLRHHNQTIIQLIYTYHEKLATISTALDIPIKGGQSQPISKELRLYLHMSDHANSNNNNTNENNDNNEDKIGSIDQQHLTRIIEKIGQVTQQNQLLQSEIKQPHHCNFELLYRQEVCNMVDLRRTVATQEQLLQQRNTEKEQMISEIEKAYHIIQQKENIIQDKENIIHQMQSALDQRQSALNEKQKHIQELLAQRASDKHDSQQYHDSQQTQQQDIDRIRKRCELMLDNLQVNDSQYLQKYMQRYQPDRTTTTTANNLNDKYSIIFYDSY